MSSAVPDIAAALETALQTIQGLRTAPFLADSITPPVALVAIEDIVYHGAFGFSDVEHTFTIFLIIGRASDRAGIEAMELYMSNTGDSSIREVLESDPTLGGVVSTLIVEKSGPPANLTVAGVAYISLPFTVLVHA